VFSALACTHLLYEGFLTRRRTEEGAFEKTQSMVTLAEDISSSVLECFCDAVVRVSEDMDILEDSPSLSTLLSRRALDGRSFLDFIHMGDREEYTDFIKIFKSSSGEESSTLSGADDVRGLQLRSVDVHLEDSFNVPVEAHVFHACLETLDEKPFYLIGIIERESYKFSKKQSGRMGSVRSGSKSRVGGTTLNFESGRLEPSRPAFEQKDVARMSDIGLLQHGASGGVASSLGMRLGRDGQKRESSPRPQILSSRSSSRSSSRKSLTAGRLEPSRPVLGQRDLERTIDSLISASGGASSSLRGRPGRGGQKQEAPPPPQVPSGRSASREALAAARAAM